MTARAVVLLLAALVVFPCLVIGGCRLAGLARTPIPQLAAFAPWTVLGWVAALALLLAARWWWVAALVLVLLAVQVSWVLPDRAARAATGPREAAVAVRVMTINACVGAADVREILRLVREHDVHLLAVEENLPHLVAALDEGLAGVLPHVVRSDPESPTGTVVWSRSPITRFGTPLGEGGQISRMVLRVPGAVPVTVTGVHTMSPGRGRIGGWTRDLMALTRASEQTAGAQVLLGDFNASRDHRPFRALLGTGLVDAADAVRTPPWRGFTWPADKRLLPVAVRIDHVLVTPSSIGVRAVRLLRVPGTDHRGVLADLSLEPAKRP